MALPSTGTLSMSQVNTELSLSSTANINLGRSDVRGLAGVASGAIAFSNLRGKSAGATVTMGSSYDYWGVSRITGFSLNANGLIYGGAGSAPTTQAGAWLTPQSGMSNYECLATIVSGTLTGTTGTWLNLGTTRTWSKTVALSGVAEVYFNVQIRKVGTTNVLATASVHLGWDGGGSVMTL